MTRPLQRWWNETTKEELDSLMPKVVEYGSSDLKIMGEALLMLNPDLQENTEPEEIAIAFYALGKIARIIGAYADGVQPSHDSWHDLAIYARMAQRVRDAGEWPGPYSEEGNKK